MNHSISQTATYFFNSLLSLFIRDIAGDDLVAWIDQRLAQAVERSADLGSALIEPLRNVYGISDKVLALGLFRASNLQ